MHYFVSDIHLGSGDVATQRRVERTFLDFLDKVAADGESLFLVGDIFDFWFEYKRVVPKGFVRVLGRLAELCDRGVRVVMLTGNHDMWVGNYLTEECGIELYTTPQTFTLAGKRLFVAHGDNMNIGGKPLLRAMNAMFRSKVLRKVASWLIHPDLFMRFGQWWSGKSRKSHAKDHITPKSLDFLLDYARDYKKEHPSTDYIIFGHMHYPYDYSTKDLRVTFLSNWDDEVQYAALDREGNLSLKTF